MSWDDRIITNGELAPYLGSQAGTLASRVVALIQQQKATWPLLREGYESLHSAEYRPIMLPGTDASEVVIQLNPRRIRSTAARVDSASIQDRRCFLCPASLPPEEKGIAYRENLIIMCNPYPVLDRHLSIIHREHVAQRIEGNLEPLLDLAGDLGPDYFVLYNGPQCGASAPDHLHFQACSRELLPIEADLARWALGPQVSGLMGCGRRVIVYRADRPENIASNIYQTVQRLGGPSDVTEPMFNIIAIHEQGEWTAYLFPRARHRPASFFAEEEQRLTISPGAIDMAGVVVMPDAAQFKRITAEQVGGIFAEVSLSQEIVDRVVTSVNQDRQRDG
jgi:hypothetical protein